MKSKLSCHLDQTRTDWKVVRVFDISNMFDVNHTDTQFSY